MAQELFKPQKLAHISNQQMAAITVHYLKNENGEPFSPSFFENTLKILIAQGISAHVILYHLEKNRYYAHLVNEQSKLINARYIVTTTQPVDSIIWAQYNQARALHIENLRQRKKDPELLLLLDTLQQSFFQLPTFRLFLGMPPTAYTLS